MKRLRLLRLLVPSLLVCLVAIVVFALRDRPSGPEGPADDGQADKVASARLHGFTITDIVGDRRRLAVSARVGSWDGEGGFQADGIERIELDREGATPLVVSAARGRGTGVQGRRVIRLEGDVEIRDDETGLLVRIPSAELDQTAGIARSLGEVVISSPGFSGRARSAVYPLDGRPTEIYGLEFHDASGGALRAAKALLPRGGGLAEFQGGVLLTRGFDRILAERLLAERTPSGVIRSAQAFGAVRGSTEMEGEVASAFRAERADVVWIEGAVSEIALLGDVVAEHGEQSLQAHAVDIARRGEGWEVAATGSVVLAGVLPSGSGRLEAASLDAVLLADGSIASGRADGGVRFVSRDVAGDGDGADLSRSGVVERVTLRSSGGRRARLAAGRTRVTAEKIVTTGRGTHLDAEGRVEATLLPDPGGREAAGRTAMFDAREAIHFVAARLEAEESGKVLRLRQNVRGWQADRNLSADEVDVDQRIDSLDARGHVATRWPRSRPASPAAGFLNVSSDGLRYRGREGLATYRGNVRARQDEGWISCGTLEVVLDGAGDGIEEVRGTDAVRIEFRSPPAGGSATSQPVTGVGDRLVYSPEAGWVRLFGDRAPAEVRRSGPDGGTTAGRVLRYALGSGRIEVESGSAEHDDPSRGHP